MTRWRSLVTSLLASVAVTVPLTAHGVVPDETKAPSSASASRTTTVKPTPKAGTVLPNLLRGQYRWMGYDTQPEGWPGGDTYYRDQIYWGRIEPVDNQFNFSYIDTGLADAEARGGKFNLRVMSYCPGCWMNYRDDWAPVTPSFIPTSPSGAPEWNNPAFITQWEELMRELGRRYGHDDRIGIVDVGGYGKYGEYWTDGDEGTISVANSQRLVAAVLKAFPKARVVINTMDPDLVLPAVRKHPTLGLRTDCLGEYNMFSIIPLYPELQTVWKRAPVISEWCHTPASSTVLGAKQVRQYHVSMVSSQNFWTPYAEMTADEQEGWRDAARSAGYQYAITSVTAPKVFVRGAKSAVTAKWRNYGSAPTYEKWRPALGLRDATGAVVWQGRWKMPLMQMGPGKHRILAKVKVSSKVKPGRYDLMVRVTHPSTRYAAMNLANAGRDDAGWYPLARVRIR